MVNGTSLHIYETNASQHCSAVAQNLYEPSSILMSSWEHFSEVKKR